MAECTIGGRSAAFGYGTVAQQAIHFASLKMAICSLKNRKHQDEILYLFEKKMVLNVR